jgi:hypothetical protein
MIVRTNKGWTVKDHTGRNLGTYKSKEEAEKRLMQIEMFKYIKTEKKKK